MRRFPGIYATVCLNIFLITIYKYVSLILILYHLLLGYDEKLSCQAQKIVLSALRNNFLLPDLPTFILIKSCKNLSKNILGHGSWICDYKNTSHMKAEKNWVFQDVIRDLEIMFSLNQPTGPIQS